MRRLPESVVKYRLNIKQHGQGMVEYALVLVLVAMIVIAALSLIGTTINQAYKKVLAGLQGTLSVQTTQVIQATPTLTAQQQISSINNLIAAFYNLHGYYPRTWSPYNFTDLGLNPADYANPINGLYISPHGNEVGIANKTGDAIQVYAKQPNGTTVHLVDGWSIWCPVNSTYCYYHTVAAGNEVIPSSIYATGY